MVRPKLADIEVPVESFTVTVTVKGPGEVGVPLKVPLDDAVMPSGNPLADQL
jgi:hypothetical protein